MKKILFFVSAVLAVQIMSFSFIACTDVSGDGVDSILYTGSNLPQNASYRNPVWEPDLELGTVFKGPTSYVAIGSESEWAKGISYCAPTLISGNLMSWSFNSNTAYPAVPDTVVSGAETFINKRPDWAEGRIHSMTAGFAKTITSTSYWMFYQIGETQAIGVSCARSPQGPYSDFGMLIDNTTISGSQLKDPFFIVVGTRFYLLYSTDQGSFVQELTLRRNKIPTLKNAAVKISNASFADVAVFKKDINYYIFGTVKNGDKTQINYARSAAITGPFVDESGVDLLTGNGTPLIQNGTELVNPENVCGVFTDFTNVDFILYNATESAKPLLSSGYNRRPLLLNKLTMSSDGWIEGILQPVKGWSSPKFIDK